MKRIRIISSLFMTGLLILSTVVFTGCKKEDRDIDDNTLGGDTNIPLNQVGNTFQGGILLNDQIVNGPPYSCQIIESHDGIATIELIYDLRTSYPGKNTFHGFNRKQ